jgi:hypothetical protein
MLVKTFRLLWLNILKFLKVKDFEKKKLKSYLEKFLDNGNSSFIYVGEFKNGHKLNELASDNKLKVITDTSTGNNMFGSFNVLRCPITGVLYNYWIVIYSHEIISSVKNWETFCYYVLSHEIIHSEQLYERRLREKENKQPTFHKLLNERDPDDKSCPVEEAIAELGSGILLYKLGIAPFIDFDSAFFFVKRLDDCVEKTNLSKRVLLNYIFEVAYERTYRLLSRSSVKHNTGIGFLFKYYLKPRF